MAICGLPPLKSFGLAALADVSLEAPGLPFAREGRLAVLGLDLLGMRQRADVGFIAVAQGLMKRPEAPPRMPSKATSTAKSTSHATKPRKPASKPKTKAGVGGDWRTETLGRMRKLIQEADPDAVEEVKWRKPSNAMQGVPTWSHDGLICTGETYKDKVKFTFAKGAALDDPAGLFNAADTGATRRAIDIHEGGTVDADAFKALIRAAVALNTDS